MTRVAHLKYAVAIFGLLLIVGLAAVFLGSMKPSERAEAIRSDWAFRGEILEGLNPGEVRTAMTERGPVFVVKPSDEMLHSLESNRNRVRNPLSNTYDAERDLFIVWGVYQFRSTGCALHHAPRTSLGERTDWPGGYFDPCSGLHFDYAGRIIDIPESWREPNLRRPLLEFQADGWVQITGLMNLPDES